jgi:hypothetical protein
MMCKCSRSRATFPPITPHPYGVFVAWNSDHAGVPNAILVKEGCHVAKMYNNKSVAEQNSGKRQQGMCGLRIRFIM